MYSDSCLMEKELTEKGVIRNMALRILMQPFSVVNGTSTSTKMGTDAR